VWERQKAQRNQTQWDRIYASNLTDPSPHCGSVPTQNDGLFVDEPGKRTPAGRVGALGGRRQAKPRKNGKHGKLLFCKGVLPYALTSDIPLTTGPVGNAH